MEAGYTVPYFELFLLQHLYNFRLLTIYDYLSQLVVNDVGRAADGSAAHDVVAALDTLFKPTILASLREGNERASNSRSRSQ